MPPPRGGSLLSRPIETLLAELDQRACDDVLAAAARSTARLGEEEEARVSEALASCALTRSALWGDTHAPKSFPDLLSDEAVNRQVLQWLKAWDGCVFGAPAPAQHAARAPRAPPARTPAPGASASKRTGKRPFPGRGGGGGGGGAGGGGGGGGAFVGGDDSLAYARRSALQREAASRPGLGRDGRPAARVLLLCGPPGCGKTTAARVATAHCGYRLLEVDASDERGGGGQLRRRLLDALQMGPLQGVGGADPRPALLLLDDMDAAAATPHAKAVVDDLVALAQAEQGGAEEPQAGGDDDAPYAPRRPRRGGDARTLLRRPLVVVCGDASAPWLRPLRDVAFVCRFAQPSPARIAARLAAVAAAERVAVAPRAVACLAERCGGDVRAALSALQVLARSRRGSPVTVADVAAVVGCKDLTVGPQHAWRALFERPRPAPGAPPRWASSLAVLTTVGDAALVTAGAHEGLLNGGARYVDSTCARTCAALALLSTADALLPTAGSGCVLPLLLGLTPLVGAHPGERTDVAWPTAAAAARRATAERAALLASWRAACCVGVRCSVGGGAALDTLPFLLTATAPRLRVCAPSAMSAGERGALRDAVAACVSYGLSFAASFGVAKEGAHTSQLDLHPPIADLVLLGDAAGGGRHVLPQALRQLVAQEVAMERIRRGEAARAGRGATTTTGKAATVAAAASAPTGGAKLLQQYKAVTGGAKPRKRAADADRPVFTAFYKFHEGYTNAVRRPLLMRDLIR